MEYLLSTIFHTFVLKNFEMRLNIELWLCFYIEDKVGMEYLLSIVLQTVTENF